MDTYRVIVIYQNGTTEESRSGTLEDIDHLETLLRNAADWKIVKSIEVRRDRGNALMTLTKHAGQVQ